MAYIKLFISILFNASMLLTHFNGLSNCYLYQVNSKFLLKCELILQEAVASSTKSFIKIFLCCYFMYTIVVILFLRCVYM